MLCVDVTPLPLARTSEDIELGPQRPLTALLGFAQKGGITVPL